MSLTLRTRRIFVIAAIATAAIALSVASIQYYNATAAEITKIAKSDVRKNALVEVQGLSSALENKFSAIKTNLKILASAKAFAIGDLDDGQALLDNAQSSTLDLTEGYYWLDKDGRIVSYSESNTGKYPDYRGNSLAQRDYFTVPRDQLRPYTTTLMESVDKVTRIYSSYPIVAGSLSDKQFAGVVVVAINPKLLGQFMQSQLSDQSSGQTGLMDKDANILYSVNETLIGTNYYDDSFQSQLPPAIKDDFNAIIKHSLSGGAGAEDLSLAGQSATIAYAPVGIDSPHTWTAYSVYAHNLAGEVGALVDQQRNFSIIVVAAIAVVAALIASLVLSWNRRLRLAVNDKTSELRSMLGSLEHANVKLQENDHMQREFINVAAHELRTPIQPILGVSELLKDDFTRNPSKNQVPIDRETAEMVFRNAKRLERLSSDILQVTRIEGNKLKLEPEVFDLNTKVRNVVRDFEATLSSDKRAKVDFVLDLSTSPLTVEADKPKIYEVISNLVGNAVKFARAANASPKIQIQTDVATQSGSEGRDYALFKITDSGNGIDRSILPRLFTKFATKSDSGTGLGLYISKSIVEAHGGRIWAENNDGGGATFSFTLPFATTQVAEIQTEP